MSLSPKSAFNSSNKSSWSSSTSIEDGFSAFAAFLDFRNLSNCSIFIFWFSVQCDTLLENQISDIETTRVQENFSFDKSLKIKKNQKIKYKLPSIDFLKTQSKKEKLKNNLIQKYDEKSLEKILLDFGVEGKIQKVSHGPVVTLNEFEPAAGVKVSKVINLSLNL